MSIPLILPTPLAAIPVTLTLLSLVQFKTDPGTLLLFTIVVIAEPEQMTWLDGVAVATGNGLTVAVTGTLGELVQTVPSVYSKFTRLMLVPAPNSLHMSCGDTLSGNCIPNLCSCTGKPAIVVL